MNTLYRPKGGKVVSDWKWLISGLADNVVVCTGRVNMVIR